MTHIDNLDSIFKYGLLAHNNPHKKKDISNQEVNERRNHKESIYGRKVHDYVPFYFNPRNAMMYKNKNKNIVILCFDKNLIYSSGALFTNKNASTNSVKYYNNINDLKEINWDYVWSESWYNKEDSFNIKQSMMSEVLVYQNVSIKYLEAIICKDQSTKKYLKKKYNSINIIVDDKQFFK